MKKIIVSVLAFALMLSLCAGVSVSAFAQDSAAPVAENLELKTYQNVSVGGMLSAYDADGSALEYTITTQPVKGDIELETDGSFVYTPRENKKGRDYFGYKAQDAEGNISQEATVIIKIEKARKDVLYSDMRGHADEYAAVALAEHDVFTGEQLGGKYCFNPDKLVTRGEFVSLCMLTAGESAVEAVMSTGYADDADIPMWMKGYVTAAAMRGIVENGAYGAAFAADSPITQTEAALMLDKALNLTSVSYIPLDDTLAPAAAQACANLTACGVMEQTADPSYLTRGTMAKLLTGAMDLLEKR